MSKIESYKKKIIFLNDASIRNNTFGKKVVFYCDRIILPEGLSINCNLIFT